MLSRKTSNLIFYGILVAITAVVFLIRFASIGALNTRIDQVTAENRSLRTQIEAKEQEVQDNKDIASDHLYELYDKVPEEYFRNQLSYFTQAQLELVGITSDLEVERMVTIEEEVTFPVDSVFTDMQKDFKIVEVNVSFNVKIEEDPEEVGTELAVVDEFIDALYSSEQVFIVNFIQYHTPDGENYIGVQVNFLAFYKLEETN